MSVSRSTEQGSASHAPESTAERLAEAARYALLRRLAPAIRHNMAGGLQPISMIAAMLEKRLQSPSPDLAIIARNAAAMNTLSREAAACCMDLMTWLAPKDNAVVTIKAGVADAIGLITTDLSFRGFTLVNETTEDDTPVLRNTLRNVLMASLITLTDAFEAPANVVLTSKPEAEGGTTLIDIQLVKSESDVMTSGSLSAYRQLTWADVEALAQAESVSLAYTDSSAQLRLPVHPTA